jgi:hypothetical protein
VTLEVELRRHPESVSGARTNAGPALGPFPTIAPLSSAVKSWRGTNLPRCRRPEYPRINRHRYRGPTRARETRGRTPEVRPTRMADRTWSPGRVAQEMGEVPRRHCQSAGGRPSR